MLKKVAEKELTDEERESLLSTLENRFESNMARHEGISWADVEARLDAVPDKLWSLHEMERTGGEPDVIGRDEETGEFVFADCSTESPEGRRGLCYDRKALEERKRNRPHGSAVEAAAAMGAELQTEGEYRTLQELGEFDTTTSSWLKTPSNIRSLGGAIFGDFRFGRVFVYHNGAQSYYAARGFRCVLRI